MTLFLTLVIKLFLTFVIARQSTESPRCYRAADARLYLTLMRVYSATLPRLLFKNIVYPEISLIFMHKPNVNQFFTQSTITVVVSCCCRTEDVQMYYEETSHIT